MVKNNSDSNTLREFSLSIVNKRGAKFTIRYGYDLSRKHPSRYVKASIDGSDFSSNKSTMKRVRALGIDAINNLIDSIGTDVSGAPVDYENTGETLINSYISTGDSQTWSKITDHYNATSVDENEELGDFIDRYEEATPRSRKSKLRKYNNSRRIQFLDNSKSVIKGLREFYWKGIVIQGKKYLPHSTGTIKKDNYESYYKRDIDYIRKARVSVFTKILKRKYRPYGK